MSVQESIAGEIPGPIFRKFRFCPVCGAKLVDSCPMSGNGSKSIYDVDCPQGHFHGHQDEYWVDGEWIVDPANPDIAHVVVSPQLK